MIAIDGYNCEGLALKVEGLTIVMPDFQDHCTVRPGLPGHSTTRAKVLPLTAQHLSSLPGFE